MKYSIIRHILFAFLLMGNHLSYSQVDTSKTILIEDNQIEESYDTEYKFIAKTNPISFLNNWQGIEVERIINPLITVQAGVGLNWGIPFLPSLLAFSDLDEFNTSTYCESEMWANDYCDNYYDGEIRDYKLGYILSLSTRFYYDESAADDFYIALAIAISSRNNTVQQIEEGSSEFVRLQEHNQDEQSQRFKFSVRYGYQTLYTTLAAEYFLGVGISKSNNTKQDIGQDENRLWHNGSRSFKQSDFILELGVRVGFQF